MGELVVGCCPPKTMKLTTIVIFCVLYLVFGNISEALITVPHKHVHHAGPYVPVPAPLIPHGGPLDRGPACYPKRCDICREKFVGTYLPSIDCEKTCGQCQVCATNPGAFPFCGTICTRSYSYCVATCKTDQKICLSCSGF